MYGKNIAWCTLEFEMSISLKIFYEMINSTNVQYVLVMLNINIECIVNESVTKSACIYICLCIKLVG